MTPKKLPIKPAAYKRKSQVDQQSTREQQLRDIATSGDESASECAASDAFKEFPQKEDQ